MSTILPLLALVASLAQASLAESPSPVRVGGKVTPPKKTKDSPPEYPQEAKRAGMMGEVILECTISPTGVATDVRVLKGAPVLNEAAIEAVRKWRYTPTLLDGVAVPVIMTVTVNFKLDGVRVPDLMASLTHESETIRAVAAENLGWMGKARLGRAVPEAIRALEELAARDPSVGVRATAARSLSKIDGRPLEGQPAAEPESSQPSSLQLAMLGGGEARPVAWGYFIDPSGDCAVEARADRVDIGIPPGIYDLSSELGRVTAPRVMRVVGGDLTAHVTVDELPLPNAAPSGLALPFRGGGLLLWLDRRNYVRLEAAVYLESHGLPVRYALFEVRRGGQLEGGRATAQVRLGDGPTDLRLEVRGPEIVAHARQGSGKWRKVGRAWVKPPAWTALGISAINLSAARLRAGFSGFEIIPDAPAKDSEGKRDTAAESADP